MKKCGIYKIISPSGKIYIGQSIDIDRRKGTYKRLESCVKNQVKLYNSIKKHGWDKHLFEVLEECTIELLNEKERYWQEFYNSNSKNNLNICLVSTSDKKQLHSEETVNKISNWHKDFHKANKNRMFGKKHKDETKQLMAEKAKERYKKESNPNCKKCYCIETGKEWNSIKECWEDMFKNKYAYSYFQTMIGGHDKNKTTIEKVNKMDSKQRIIYTKSCLEFLDYKCVTPYDKDFRIYTGKHNNLPDMIDANFNDGFLNNWNWIMEVVEAISNKFGEAPLFQEVYQKWLNENKDAEDFLIFRLSKEAVVQAINQFLLWYNLQPKTN